MLVSIRSRSNINLEHFLESMIIAITMNAGYRKIMVNKESRFWL